MLTEKSRLRRALMRLQDQVRRMRHLSIQEQVKLLNQMLRGHTVRWEQFQRIKEQFPLLRPKLHYSYKELQAIAIL